MGLVDKTAKWLLKAAEAAGKEEAPLAKAVGSLMDAGAQAEAGALRLSAADRLLAKPGTLNVPGLEAPAVLSPEARAIQNRKVLAQRKLDLMNRVAPDDEAKLAEFRAGMPAHLAPEDAAFREKQFMKNLKNRGGKYLFAAPVAAVAADELADEVSKPKAKKGK